MADEQAAQPASPKDSAPDLESDASSDDVRDSETDDEQVSESSEPAHDVSSKRIPKALSKKNLQQFREARENSGLVYMSRVPPYMKPQKVRHLLEPFGQIGRIYLAPEGGSFPLLLLLLSSLFLLPVHIPLLHL